VLPAIGCFWQGAPDLVLARQSLVSFCLILFVLIMVLAAAPSRTVQPWALVKANCLKTCVRAATGPYRFGEKWLSLELL
ncbi:MAG: hypothetical protein VYE62_01645, partial [Pseudomonadota bacterium]|nr:hypothetical protein [Pseudomonadota bacterium]